MIKQLTERLVKSRIRNWQDHASQQVRTRYGVLGGWLSIWVNVVLTLAKAALALFTGSLSLAADAIHSLSDAGTSLVIVVSFKAAEKPADARHPFGHGRMEAIATLVVSMLIILAGFELGKSGFARLADPGGSFHFSWPAVIAVFLTIIIKEVLGRISLEMAGMIESSALKADAWHHRIDAISSVMVIAAFFGQKIGLVWIDGAMSIIISGMIVYTGYIIARDGIDELLGKSPSKELVADIKALIHDIPEVTDVHDVIVHQYGTQKVMSMHVSVPDTLSLKHAHRISETAAALADRRFNAHTTVHLDPVVSDDAVYAGAAGIIREVLDGMDKNVSFYDLQIDGPPAAMIIYLELRSPDLFSKDACGQVSRELHTKIARVFPEIQEVRVTIGPTFAY